VTPEISVVVPSHERPIRLRWLLNALEEQTLDRRRFEVVVVHDSAGPETDELLRTHPLAEVGVLRGFSLDPGSGGSAIHRNRGWREARAPLAAFTDDDCRPPPEWLERVLTAAKANPSAVVQGATRPDPDEIALVHHCPHARTMTVDPPVPWGHTCNIVYPREWLERAGGFDETFELTAGEDTDLAQRVVADGAAYVGAPDALTYHAVHAVSLLTLLRSLWRWQQVPLLIKRHPQLRRGLPLRLFWKTRHARMALALAGLAVARRRPAAALLALPWVAEALPSYGGGVRGRLRAGAELPGRAAIDLTEMVALARGSARYRTLLL
jgi:GT2 family glycosyltransferase